MKLCSAQASKKRFDEDVAAASEQTGLCRSRRGLSLPQEFKSRAQLAVVDLQAGGEFVAVSEHELGAKR